MDHQPGVRGYDKPMDVALSVVHYPTSRDVLKTFTGFPLMFKPGNKIEYASLSFTVAGAAAESVTGHLFQQLSADFFAKYGIGGITVDDPLAIVPKRVWGYLVDANRKIEFNDGRVVDRGYVAGTANAGTKPVPTTLATAIRRAGSSRRARTFCVSLSKSALARFWAGKVCAKCGQCREIRSRRQYLALVGGVAMERQDDGRNEWSRAVYDYLFSILSRLWGRSGSPLQCRRCAGSWEAAGRHPGGCISLAVVLDPT